MSEIKITCFSGKKKRLLTAGKYCAENIIVEVPAGGGDCSGTHVIEVTELPTENIDTNALYLCNGAYYKYSKEFTDVFVVANEQRFYVSDMECYFHTIPTKNTDGLIVTEYVWHCYYIEDENVVAVYGGAENGWIDIGFVWSVTCGGVITDPSEATEEGYYVVMTRGWTKYVALITVATEAEAEDTTAIPIVNGQVIIVGV